MSRLDMYLKYNTGDAYVNSKHEAELVNKFDTLYRLAKSAHDTNEHCSPANIAKWRKAYYGTLNALDQNGKESQRKSRQLRKMVYEFVESKIDNSIPAPKIQARYKDDIPLVNITEEYLKFETNGLMTKYENDKNERATYVDGTTWFKVGWDSLNNSHERSGDVTIKTLSCEQVIPQPGVTNYKDLEYIFEIEEVSTTKLWDLYRRNITPTTGDTNLVKVISCYYLNDDRIVGLFMWAESSHQVICNEKDWQIRKLRTCSKCGTVNPTADSCIVCGSKSFKYENAVNEILSEDLIEVYNPYDVGETDDVKEKDRYEERVFLTAGTEVPFYRIRQLPFVPRPSISSLDSIYGISEVQILLDMQDAANKVLTKAFDKTMKSGAVVTKPQKMKIGDSDDTFKVFGVRTAEEAAMVQAKQIMADTSQDIMISSMLYESARASSGVTESFQGKADSSASSGKAKQFAALQSAGRIESLRVMKSAAYAGVYELVFKYLLAFSDEPRRFVKTLPDGKETEEEWNKYMFLAKDKYGNIYYRDDFRFGNDTAATLSQDRQSMWQETREQFLQGSLGVPSESRTLTLYWNIMNMLGYPLAKLVLAGIKENAQHLPDQVEQAIMSNPQAMAMLGQILSEGTEQRGGARPNSGPEGNGATHAANVERTNERNRAQKKDEAFAAQNTSVSEAGGKVNENSK